MTRKFAVQLDCDNDSFIDNVLEVARILEELAGRLRHAPLRDAESGALRDANGNTVGWFEFTADHECPENPHLGCDECGGDPVCNCAPGDCPEDEEVGK